MEDRRQEQLPLKLREEYRLKERVKRKFRQGVNDFNLIEIGDRILVGLSGGKDSLALLELLGELKRHRRGGFALWALHVRMVQVNYVSDLAYLRDFCEKCGAEFIVKNIDFEPDRNEKRTPCFLCSWNRRKVLFETAKELGCNKIAFGHHQDDLLKTALMNLAFNGSFATMPAFLKLHKMPLTIVRPLCRVEEEDLKKWSVFRHYRPLVKLCPHERESNRTNVDNVMDALQNLNAESRYSLWNALEKEGKLVEM